MIFGKSQQIKANVARKSPLVYTCDKSCIGERDKRRIKNGRFSKVMFTRTRFQLGESHIKAHIKVTGVIVLFGD